MRLDKFISNQKNISRTEVKALIKKGQVRLADYSGRITPEMQIDEDSVRVFVGGEEIIYRKFTYIMLNKPAGVVCATRDGLSETVLSLLPPELRKKGLFPAGRLDKDTEGFVLITDDGAFAHKILSPKSHVQKIYFARLKNSLTEEEEREYFAVFQSGMDIGEGDICQSAEIYFSRGRADEVFVILHEGMYHQVKRMFRTLGNEVVYLKRVQIGGLPLDPDLAVGECREIMHKEMLEISTHIDFLNSAFGSLTKFSSN